MNLRKRLRTMVAAGGIATTLALAGGDPAAAACYLPGDHWVTHSSTLRSYWDWNGWTTCYTPTLINWCSRKYFVRYFMPTGGGVFSDGWGYIGVSEWQTKKCWWLDGV